MPAFRDVAVSDYLADAFTFVGNAQSNPILRFVTYKQHRRFGVIYNILDLLMTAGRIYRHGHGPYEIRGKVSHDSFTHILRKHGYTLLHPDIKTQHPGRQHIDGFGNLRPPHRLIKPMSSSIISESPAVCVFCSLCLRQMRQYIIHTKYPSCRHNPRRHYDKFSYKIPFIMHRLNKKQSQLTFIHQR